MQYKIEEYVTATGKSPYADWFDNLREIIARANLAVRIHRAQRGNFSDWNSLAGTNRICELRRPIAKAKE